MKDLKLGLQLGYWAARPPEGFVEMVQQAERLGFDSVWTAEAYGSDAITPLAYLAAQTETIRLGTGVCQLSARTPTAMAMAAMTLDHLSQGRFILGLGVSGPQVVEGWYGGPSPNRSRARGNMYRSSARSSSGRNRSPTMARTTPCPTRAKDPGVWARP